MIRNKNARALRRERWKRASVLWREAQQLHKQGEAGGDEFMQVEYELNAISLRHVVVTPAVGGSLKVRAGRLWQHRENAEREARERAA